MLRFVTLIPVVLAVAAVLKLGTTAIDQKFSMRPLAVELASVETHKLPVAVCGVSREVEFGLAFYRDQIIDRYEAGKIPAGEHLVVAAPSWKPNLMEWTKGRRVTSLGHYAPQALDYYWVGASTTGTLSPCSLLLRVAHFFQLRRCSHLGCQPVLVSPVESLEIQFSKRRRNRVRHGLRTASAPSSLVTAVKRTPPPSSAPSAAQFLGEARGRDRVNSRIALQIRNTRD
jgi:hypothetical protein